MGRHDFFSKLAPRPTRLRFAVSRVAALVLVLVVLAWVAFSIIFSPPPAAEELDSIPLVADPEHPAATEPLATLTVHVVGAVKKPGVYELPDGSRITDAIEAAGGMSKKARPELLNLAAKLADGQQIILPGTSDASATPGAPQAQGPNAKISLNQADAQTLQTLPGIGPALAKRIIDFRDKNGPFTSVAELDAVSGIGPVLLGELSELVIP
ncbi:helix-hairpin-helix domain-containing protein [Glutamicibacter sp. AOP38-B1-38]|uniref:helix-hairpin-helix domain-containing protein n=1 Tax=unclassified Glutamicibacter TaxID=2627139 RepID=UPI004034E6BC